MELRRVDRGITARAPAKINVWLEVGQVRPDGFHDIDSLFQAVGLWDDLEFRWRDERDIELVEEGISDREDNLVYRAARKLWDEVDGRVPGGVSIRLTKGIPFGAGLGGGSSDVAATLVALAGLWRLDVSLERLEQLGAELGSDVSFFFHGGLARVGGRGERVRPLALPRGMGWPQRFGIISPKVHVSTPSVYRALDARRQDPVLLTVEEGLDSMLRQGEAGQGVSGQLFFNRLERVTCDEFPQLDRCRSYLREFECFDAVLLSGSGASFFVCVLDGGENSAGDSTERDFTEGIERLRASWFAASARVSDEGLFSGGIAAAEGVGPGSESPESSRQMRSQEESSRALPSARVFDVRALAAWRSDLIEFLRAGPSN